MNKEYLHNKVFLVTGSSSGIGLEVVKLLLENKSTVIAMIRQPSSDLKELDKIYGNRLILFTGDISVQSDCQNFVKFAHSKTKIVHGLIHCAGTGIRSFARDINYNVYHRIMETNFSSSVYLYQAIRKYLENTNGYFVVVSSIQGLMTLPFRSVYTAAKHALNAYIKSVRLEEKLIHFLVVNFGYVNTNFSRNALRGNGEKYSILDEGQSKGMSPQKAAVILIKAMIQGKREITPAGFKEKLALLIYNLMPRLYNKLIVKYVKH